MRLVIDVIDRGCDVGRFVIHETWIVVAEESVSRSLLSKNGSKGIEGISEGFRRVLSIFAGDFR